MLSIVALALIVAGFTFAPLLGLLLAKVLPMDMHYGEVSFSSDSTSGAFATEQISDDVISPDVIIDEDLFTSTGDLNIETILAWDIGAWMSDVIMPNPVTFTDEIHLVVHGITKDNTVGATAPPTADSAAGGAQIGQESADTRYVRRWVVEGNLNATNAAGERNHGWIPRGQFELQARTILGPAGRDYGYPLTAAHYHTWLETQGMGSVSVTVALGAQARRIEVDFAELLFDRLTLVGILQAVGQVF